MPKQVNIHEAKTHLSSLLDDVAGGEEIIIANRGTPVAVIRKFPTASARPRKGGVWARKVRIHDDFDAPLPPEIQGAFSGDSQ